MNVPSGTPAGFGRIVERIVANELESVGYRVIDLNVGGAAGNADLLASRLGQSFQIQVKGAFRKRPGPWVQYGYCNPLVLSGQESVFNKHKAFYSADIVVLVSFQTLREYDCVVLPVRVAEQAAQINVDRQFRSPLMKGGKRSPNAPIWTDLKYLPNTDLTRRASMQSEQDLLSSYWGREAESLWDLKTLASANR